MSISKAQAKALSSNFFDNLGTKEKFEPRETLPELYVVAGDFIDEANKELQQAGSIASGNLSRSLEVVNPTARSIDIQMDFYGKFVNDGVRGTKSGTGKYAFKNSFPGEKMVLSIEKWMLQGKKKTKNVNVKKTPYKNEKKNAAIGELSPAYAVARAVKMHGIKPIGFIDKAAKTITDKIGDKLGKAFKIDIINSLPDKLN